MFGEMQIKEKEEKLKNLDFFSLTKKYWKEQIFFYVFTSLSCVSSYIINENVKQISIHKQLELVSFGHIWTFYKKFQNSREWYIILALLGIFLYFLIVFVHVWFALHLEAKVRRYLKKLIIQKTFKLEGFCDKQKVSSLLNYSVKLFSRNVFYIPNQLYYVGAEILLVIIDQFLIRKKKSFKSLPLVRALFSSYFLLFFFICAASQLLLYYLELNYHSLIENEIKEELFLIENRDLMIKKSESSEFLRVYSESLDNIFHRAITRNLSETFSFVFPSYFLIKLFPFLCVYYVGNLDATIANSIISLIDVFTDIRKVVERVRDFPFYYSSERKINEFLSGKERDDKQNEQVIPDHIQSIKFKNVAFTYQNEREGSRKEVLNDFSIFFETGKINEMNFPNGFGKSTIINLVTGMLKPQSGEILVNEIYNLGDIDIDWWRSSISYSEHRNLISRLDLSTGQKQLIDLNNAFENERKQIFIFDEADSNLDHKNRSEFLDRLKELSTRKLVILVSHHTQK